MNTKAEPTTYRMKGFNKGNALKDTNYSPSGGCSHIGDNWRERANAKPLTITRTNGERNEFI